MNKKYLQQKKTQSHIGKTQDLTKNAHFLRFFQKCTCCICDFLIEEIFFSCYKKNSTELAVDKISFLVPLRENTFSVLVFWVWITKEKKMENDVFSKESEIAHIAYAIFCLKKFFFSCYKKKSTELAVDEISFLVPLREKTFSVSVFWVWITKKTKMENDVFSQESAHFDLKTHDIQTKKIHIYVGFQYFLEFQKNNESIHRHV